MSSPQDPDEPTRRLPPTHGPPAPPPRVHEREVVVADDDIAWREEILDRLDSLRTAVVLLGVLAVAALGLAVWALLTKEEEGDARRGASVEQVRNLEERVEELEQDVDRAPSRDALSQLSDTVDSLDERVAALETRVERQGPDEEQIEALQGDVQQLGDAIEQVGDTVEQLDQRVAALEQQD